MFRRRTPLLCTAAASAATSNKKTTLVHDTATNIHTLTLASPPVNALTRCLITEISSAVEQVESFDKNNKDNNNKLNKKSAGLIITSSVPNIVSGGLDLKEMHRPESREKITSYLRLVNSLYLRLNKSPLVTAVALTGHAPAGACLISMSCDYRIMVKEATTKNGNSTTPYRIGLNETQLGLCAPDWAMEMMSFCIGARKADELLQLGAMIPAEEAHALGLVDDLASDPEECMAKARAAVTKLMQPPALARARTKQMMRAPIVKRLVEFDEDFLIDQLTSEEVQSALDVYVENMKKKK